MTLSRGTLHMNVCMQSSFQHALVCWPRFSISTVCRVVNILIRQDENSLGAIWNFLSAINHPRKKSMLKWKTCLLLFVVAHFLADGRWLWLFIADNKTICKKFSCYFSKVNFKVEKLWKLKRKLNTTREKRGKVGTHKEGVTTGSTIILHVPHILWFVLSS